MTVGTKSVLFGAHCFAYHWIAVAIAWWRLYRWQPALESGWLPGIVDPRAWFVFIAHDWGYVGRSDMDGPVGEAHPFWCARLASALFDGTAERVEVEYAEKQVIAECRLDLPGPPGRGQLFCWVFECADLGPWGLFALLHSRHLAKTLNLHPSRLCAADKLSLTYTPWWLYLPGVVASGEVEEYMELARARGAAVGVSHRSKREWYETMRAYCARWAIEHADGREVL